jgi:diguanylate cyclase (GGDEF)-like protein/PAS domain S-box-containing protein
VVLAAVLISLWCGVLWSVHSTRELGMEDLRRETSALSLLFASHADTTFRTFNLALNELRTGWLQNEKDLERRIVTHLGLLPGAFVQAGIADTDGTVTFTFPTAKSRSVNIADRDYFAAHAGRSGDNLFVGRPIFGRISGKWSIPVSRPIYRDGRFAGVVYATIDPDYFVSFYWVANIGRDGVATMVRDTGEVMTRSTELESFIGQRIQPSPYADPGAPLQGHFTRAAQTDGVLRFYGYVRLPQYGLSVLIGPSLSEGLSLARKVQQQALIAAGVVTLIILAVGWVIHLGYRREHAIKRDLYESEERFRSIFSSLLEGVVLYELVLDASGKPINYRLLQINPAFERQTGLKPDSLRGKLATEAYGVDSPPFLELYAEVAQTGKAASFEFRSEQLGRDYVVQVVSPKPGFFATVFDDITERKELQQQREADMKALQEQYRTITRLHAQLQEQVVHDPLTGLHNRRYLEDMMPREMALAERQHYPVAFIMFDIDKFKSVNDTYGHAVGDRVLQAVSEVLKQQARESDLLFRLGGEEFLMVLPNMNAHQAVNKANACRLGIAAQIITSNGVDIRATISAGVSVYPDLGSEVHSLISLADQALYAAKGNGRNRVELAGKPVA